MATKSHLIQIIVRARDDASKVVKGIRKRFGTLLAVAGVGSAVALGVKLVRTFGKMVDAGVSFEKEMSAVAAISGATGTAFEKLEANAKEMGRTTIFAANQAAQGQRALAQAGLNANRILTALPKTLTLAAAGELELGEAAEIAATVTKGLNRTFEELGETVDVLAFTASNSNQTIRDIGTSMSFASTSSSLLGVGLRDTASAMALLADRGLDASRAGTGLNRSFAILAGQVEKDEKGLKGFNVELFDSKGKFVGLSEAIRRMNAAGIRGSQAFDIFGTRAGQAMAILLENGPKALEDFRAEMDETLIKMDELGGFAEVIMARKLDNLAGDVTLLKSAWEGLSIALFDQASPALRSITQQITSLVQSLAEAAETTDRLDTAIALFAGGAATALELIVKAFAGVGIAINLVEVAIAAMGEKGIEVFDVFFKVANQFRRAVGLDAIDPLSDAKDAYAAWKEEAADDAAAIVAATLDVTEGLQKIRAAANRVLEGGGIDAAKLLSQEQVDKAVETWNRLFDAIEGDPAKTRAALKLNGQALLDFLEEVDNVGLEVPKRLRDMAREAFKALSEVEGTGAGRGVREAVASLDSALEAAGFITQARADEVAEKMITAFEASEVPLRQFGAAMEGQIGELMEKARASGVALSAEFVGMATAAIEAVREFEAQHPEPVPEEIEPEPEARVEADVMIPDEEELEAVLAAAEAQEKLNEQLLFGEAAAQAFARSFADSVAAVATGAISIGKAARQIAADVIKSLASEALVKAAVEIAEAFAALARFDPASAALHFAAAGKWLLVGTVATVAAAKVAGRQFGSGSAGEVAGPGGFDVLPRFLTRKEVVLDPNTGRSILGGRGAVVPVGAAGRGFGFGQGGSPGGVDLGGLDGEGGEIHLHLGFIDSEDGRRFLVDEGGSIGDALRRAQRTGELDGVT